MNQRTKVLGFLLLLSLALGLGLVRSGVKAQNRGFQLLWGTFSLAGTGAEPLTSEGFKMQVILGEPGPVGNAGSENFSLEAGSEALMEEAARAGRIYLPIVMRE